MLWAKESVQAFQALTSSLVLRNPDFSLTFTVHTDTSEKPIKELCYYLAG